MAKPVPEPVEAFKELRAKTLALSWRKLGFAPTEKNPHVWGVMMEVGYPKAVVSLVCLKNGSVDFFFGHGGGIMGIGENESVRMKAEEFIQTAEVFLKKLNPAKKLPMPEIERVRFYVFTFSGILTAQDNKNIADEKHELFPLFRSGHEVIAAIRKAQDATAGMKTL